MELLGLDAADPVARNDFSRRVLSRLEEKAEGSSAFSRDPESWLPALEKCLESGRQGSFAEGIDADLFMALFFSAENDMKKGLHELDDRTSECLRERSILASWYFFASGLPDKTENQALGGWLEAFCRSAEEQASELVRGRLLWLRLNLLERRGADDDIAELLRYFHGREKAAWVWERIAAFLSGWDGTWRLYRELHAWPELAGKEAKDLLPTIRSRQARAFSEAIGIVEGYRSKLPELVDRALANELPTSSVDWIFECYAKGGFDFPLSAMDFFRRYSELESPARGILIHWLDRYAQLAPEGALDAHLLHNLAETGKTAARRLERLVGRLAEAELARRAGQPGMAYRSILEAVIETVELAGPQGISPSAAQDFHQKLTPRLIRLIVAPSPVGAGPDIDPHFDQLAHLLSSKSGLVQAMGVDILLAFQKTGQDVSPAIPGLREILASSPDTKGFMDTKGGDLGESPPLPFFVLPHVDSFIDAPPASSEGDFMSLDRLTGLFEIVTRPDTAWRSAKILRTLAQLHGDSELMAFLAGFRKVNSVLEDLNPVATKTPAKVHKQAGVKSGATLALSPREEIVSLEESYIVGPLSVPEIAAAISALSVANSTTIHSRAAGLRQTISRSSADRYSREIEAAQRRAIAGVFGEGLEESPGLFASIHKACCESGGITNPTVSCVHDPDRWNPDLLAWYRPRTFLGQTAHHSFGVYFCARNLVECAQSTGSDPADLVRVVAVHEWFHAFIEQLLGKDFAVHANAHGGAGFCRLEEAAANAVARVYLSKAVDKEHGAAIDKVLFEEPAAKAEPGYGEWRHMGFDAMAFVPSLLAKGKHVIPPEYGLERTAGAFTHDPFERSVASGLWASLLAGLEGETIPCWLDLRAFEK